jgi:hypothetical protein
LLVKNSNTDYDTIWVTFDPPNNLYELSDVSVTGPIADEVLSYSGANWTNVSFVGLLNMYGINELNDVVTQATPTTGSVLYWTSTAWADLSATAWAGSYLPLDSLSDVTITGPVAGQALVYNGTGWVNTTASTDPMNDANFTAIITTDVGP